jgi:hypothetical protein
MERMRLAAESMEEVDLVPAGYRTRAVACWVLTMASLRFSVQAMSTAHFALSATICVLSLAALVQFAIEYSFSLLRKSSQ